jgi:hypothetical protein
MLKSFCWSRCGTPRMDKLGHMKAQLSDTSLKFCFGQLVTMDSVLFPAEIEREREKAARRLLALAQPLMIELHSVHTSTRSEVRKGWDAKKTQD